MQGCRDASVPLARQSRSGRSYLKDNASTRRSDGSLTCERCRKDGIEMQRLARPGGNLHAQTGAKYIAYIAGYMI